VSCEWDPDKKVAARESHAKATWRVGAKGQWHLCDDCAKLPEFKKYTSRGRLRSAPPQGQQRDDEEENDE